ncbi:MAG: tRNA (cytosine(32)/uridine(32)-2'-O)-methyltransferase TrmJ [Gemmatimonadota bacterium]|nr:tRNA (cytosine(32)/uridine(32)-2'-O)-methyltransferase TrmJ [Gemmatimonadota bacterium]
MPLDRVRVVLLEPRDPVNVAAVVRAMKNMGVGSLRLVRPAAYDTAAIERVAHGSAGLVERIRNDDTLDAALDGCVRVAAFTARRRAAKRAVVDPRAAAVELLAFAAAGDVALVFGREDRGLPNAALDRAQLVVTIPTTEHASLNLAQAVLLGLYELRLAAPDPSRVLAPPRKDAPPATHGQLEQFFEDAERALAGLDFFKTRHPENIMRTVRSLTARGAPDAREIGLMRAMAIEVLRTIERMGQRP